jgi:protein kinase A
MPSFGFRKKKRKNSFSRHSPFSHSPPRPQLAKPGQRPSIPVSPIDLPDPAALPSPSTAAPTGIASARFPPAFPAGSSALPSPAMISVLDQLDAKGAPPGKAAPPQNASAPPHKAMAPGAAQNPSSNAPTIQSLLNASPDSGPAATPTPPPAGAAAASPSPGNNPATLAAAPSSHPQPQGAAPSGSSIAGLLQQQPGLQPAPAQPQLLQYLPQQHAAAQAALRETRGKYALTDFALQRTLGTGSFGRVHLVQSRHNSRFYAVKVLKKAQVVKMKQVEHTNDERRMLQRVKHPFLITLWGTFQDAKNLYMVMDFVEGGELFSLLRKSQVSGFLDDFPSRV